MRIISLLIITLSLSVSPCFATTMLQMNLEEMTSRSDKIFRGTLVNVRSATVNAGGGEIATVIYAFRVDEVFKGEVETLKGVQVAEIQMLGTLDKQRAGQRVIPGFPLYRVGDQYLLLVAPAGRTGLTTTMGLGQGSFHIYRDGKRELAVNEYGNVNLRQDTGGRHLHQGHAHAHDAGSTGPLPYRELADQIRTLVRQ